MSKHVYKTNLSRYCGLYYTPYCRFTEQYIVFVENINNYGCITLSL